MNSINQQRTDGWTLERTHTRNGRARGSRESIVVRRLFAFRVRYRSLANAVDAIYHCDTHTHTYARSNAPLNHCRCRATTSAGTRLGRRESARAQRS